MTNSGADTARTFDLTRTEPYGYGLEVRRQVLGDDYVDRAMADPSALSAEYQQLSTFLWGAVWGRPGIERSTRSLVVLSSLASLGRWDEFRLHVGAALRNGCQPGEIKEAIFSVAVYAGFPVGLHAFKIVEEAIAQTAASSDDG